MIYKGKSVFNNGNYLAVYLPTHHRATSNGVVHLHILAMEEKLGRPLKDEEVVHHVDENKHNNSLENLWCFRTQSDHASYHNGGILLQDEEGIYFCDKLSKGNICAKCGNEKKDKYSLICLSCAQKERRENSKIGNITREELKVLIKDFSFVALGEKFNCSDNAIRKRCKKLNLPYKKSEINKFTEEEWNGI